jgi:hypothetical protein
LDFVSLGGVIDAAPVSPCGIMFYAIRWVRGHCVRGRGTLVTAASPGRQHGHQGADSRQWLARLLEAKLFASVRDLAKAERINEA